MAFFPKIMVAEKNNFSSNAKCNFANGKVISKKKTLKSASPHLLRRPAPATFTPFHPKFFRFPPLRGGVIKIYSPPLYKRGGGGGPNYDQASQFC